MAQQTSAGVLVYRLRAGGAEFLLGHPGGPFWRNKDDASWSVPKGVINTGEDALAAARREFFEETGLDLQGPFLELAPVQATRDKRLRCWMIEADLNLDAFQSNLFELEWPRKSGRLSSFPELDRVAYHPWSVALIKIHRGQRPLLVEAAVRLGQSPT